MIKLFLYLEKICSCKNSNNLYQVIPPFSYNSLPIHFLLLIATNKVNLRNTKGLLVFIIHRLPNSQRLYAGFNAEPILVSSKLITFSIDKFIKFI
jgi:hypothetical protein